MPLIALWFTAKAHWAESGAFDCYPGCTFDQTMSGAGRLFIPFVVAILLIALLLRLRHVNRR